MNTRDDRGALAVSIGFILVATGLLTAILAIAIGMLTNTRVAAEQQDDRYLIREVFENLITSGDKTIPKIDVKGEGRYCVNRLIPRYLGTSTTFNVCTTVEQLPGEDAYQGVRVDMRINGSRGARYYTTHLNGYYSASMQSLQKGIQEISAPDSIARAWGFAGTRVSAGQGGTLTSYTPLTGNPTDGVRITAASVVLGRENPDRVQLVWSPLATSDVPRIPGGMCSGTCTTADIRNMKANLRHFGTTYARPSPNSSATCPPDPHTEPWRSSENGGVLTVPADGLCVSGLIFDRNTTVSNPDGQVIRVGDGGVTVDANAQVNMNNATWPDPSNLIVVIDPGGSSTGAAFYSAPGSKFAGSVLTQTTYAVGRALASGCVVRGAVYGSMFCGYDLDATTGSLYYPREWKDANDPPNFFGDPLTKVRPIWLPDYNNTVFKRVSKTEAGY